MQGVHADLSQLQNLSHGRIELRQGGTVDVAAVTNIDSASFYVYDGSTLALPGATRYTHASTGSSQYRYFYADGPGSRLDLSGLTTITGGTNYNARLFLKALGGGVIDVSGVTQIDEPASGDLRSRSIDVTAEGPGSMVDLSSLQSYTDRSSGETSGYALYSTIEASYGGTILAPQLTTLRGVRLQLNPHGTLPIAQIAALTWGRVDLNPGSYQFPALTDATGTYFSVTGAQADLSHVTQMPHGGIELWAAASAERGERGERRCGQLPRVRRRRN